jgi:hypothetical protein
VGRARDAVARRRLDEAAVAVVAHGAAEEVGEQVALGVLLEVLQRAADRHPAPGGDPAEDRHALGPRDERQSVATDLDEALGLGLPAAPEQADALVTRGPVAAEGDRTRHPVDLDRGGAPRVEVDVEGQSVLLLQAQGGRRVEGEEPGGAAGPLGVSCGGRGWSGVAGRRVGRRVGRPLVPAGRGRLDLVRPLRL